MGEGSGGKEASSSRKSKVHDKHSKTWLGTEEDFNFELSTRRRRKMRRRKSRRMRGGERKADLSVCRSVCQGVRVCVYMWEMFACLPWQELLRFFICLLRNSFFARSFASTRLSRLCCANYLVPPPPLHTLLHTALATSVACGTVSRIVRERRSRLRRHWHRRLCLRL